MNLDDDTRTGIGGALDAFAAIMLIFVALPCAFTWTSNFDLHWLAGAGVAAAGALVARIAAAAWKPTPADTWEVSKDKAVLRTTYQGEPIRITVRKEDLP